MYAPGVHLPKFWERYAFKVADVGFYPAFKHYQIHPNQGGERSLCQNEKVVSQKFWKFFACLPACLPAFLPSFLPSFLPVCLPGCLPGGGVKLNNVNWNVKDFWNCLRLPTCSKVKCRPPESLVLTYKKNVAKKWKIAVYGRFVSKCPPERAQSTLNNLIAPSTKRGLGWGKGERSPSRCCALSAIFSKKGMPESVLGAS